MTQGIQCERGNQSGGPTEGTARRAAASSPFPILLQGLVLALLLGFTGIASAQPAGMTADELLVAAVNAYNNGRYQEAVTLFDTFLTDYGSSAQAAPALPRILPLKALALVRTNEFGPALEAIREAFAKAPQMPVDQREELAFLEGICLLSTSENTEALKVFEKFLESFPQSRKRAEALLLTATAHLIEQNYEATAATCAAIKNQLPPVDRGRAVVMELYALNQAGRLEEAKELFTTESPRAGDLLQIAAFQMIGLELGSLFLEKEEYRNAIACLQRIWSRDRLIRHQEERLKAQEQRQAALLQTASNPAALFQANQMVAKLKRELDGFKKIQHFDSALRLRLATAFMGMQRYREGALILESMLADMPPDPIVEQASINLVRCWMQIERWPRAVDSATRFEEKFPKSKTLPLILLMRGQALQEDRLYPESIAAFDDLLKRFPKDELAPRAFFFKGFSLLLADQSIDAAKLFGELPGKYPSSDMVEASVYWKGMALSLAKLHEDSRAQMAEYLRRFPDGRYLAEAKFRRAYSAQSMQDYARSIPEFRTFLSEHPGNAQTDEALVLLGDAQMSEGDVEAGIAAFKQIDPKNTKFFEEGWFKVGKALRLMEENAELRAHMKQFLDEHKSSPRIAEAIYWIGWCDRADGREEEARALYWSTIRELGNEAQYRSVEDLFPALAKLYGKENRELYLTLLRDLREEAQRNDQPLLQLRSRWAEAAVVGREQPSKAREILIEGADLLDVPTASPAMIADIADALRTQGENIRAEKLYRDLIKWNPRAPQKDRAFAGLGLMLQRTGREQEALAYFDRFERETLGSSLFAEVLLSKARLEAKRGNQDTARLTLEKILESPSSRGNEKAAALFELGELNMSANNPALAVPYYQRIYIMHGRWTDFVAKAYLRSGEAFEKMDRPEDAVRTYREMIGREELSGYAETEQARTRLQALPNFEEESRS